ncbi:hypothetical protein AB1Y20_013637 [Prymnesium parvum]|uniref:Uncharacterized protein n=1 Tax=Prymnesium parvum TaxID=97485 RepID=A0AB34IGC4_PRYPA
MARTCARLLSLWTLAAAGVFRPSAALLASPHRHATPLATSRRAPPPLSAAPPPHDSPAVHVPSTFPTFGLSARENARLAYMYRREEPLPQEILGLQLLLAFLGSKAMGVLGALLGCFQFAPCLSFFPGQMGELLRATGWHVGSAVLRTLILLDGLAAGARAQWARLAEAKNSAGCHSSY